MQHAFAVVAARRLSRHHPVQRSRAAHDRQRCGGGAVRYVRRSLVTSTARRRAPQQPPRNARTHKWHTHTRCIVSYTPISCRTRTPAGELRLVQLLRLRIMRVRAGLGRTRGRTAAREGASGSSDRCSVRAPRHCCRARQNPARIDSTVALYFKAPVACTI